MFLHEGREKKLHPPLEISEMLLVSVAEREVGGEGRKQNAVLPRRIRPNRSQTYKMQSSPTNAWYPKFPSGCGHAVSRPIAEYISQKTLIKYQGDDVSLGIWLNESGLNKSIVHSSRFAFSHKGNCLDRNAYISGHGMTPETMRFCWGMGDELAPVMLEGDLPGDGGREGVTLPPSVVEFVQSENKQFANDLSEEHRARERGGIGGA